MSGIFFGGIPGQILDAWRKHHVSFVYTPSIFAEYQRVAAVLRRRYPQRNADPVLALLLSEGILVQDLILPEPVSRDPDDDKFLACALSSGAAIVVSGDGDLLEVEVESNEGPAASRTLRTAYVHLILNHTYGRGAPRRESLDR